MVWLSFIHHLAAFIFLSFFLPSSGQCFQLRPCVSITVSSFWVILQNYTAYRENKRPNILVYFWYRYRFRQGFPFENTKMFQLVFRRCRDSNPRPRIMAQIACPRRFPLDQEASPYLFLLLWFELRFILTYHWHCKQIGNSSSFKYFQDYN